MGRLTLNVLLSFAQFEREVTSERIRDKIGASKRKGIWVGGMVQKHLRILGRAGGLDRAPSLRGRHVQRDDITVAKLAASTGPNDADLSRPPRLRCLQRRDKRALRHLFMAHAALCLPQQQCREASSAQVDYRAIGAKSSRF
jgi:hypothetical protein